MRGILGVVLTAVLLVGCGGAGTEGSPESLGAQEQAFQQPNTCVTADDCPGAYDLCCPYKDGGNMGLCRPACTNYPDSIPARGDDTGVEAAPAVTASTLTYCYIMESRSCRSLGTKILCTPDGYSTETCYCDGWQWDCPPYENGPVED